MSADTPPAAPRTDNNTDRFHSQSSSITNDKVESVSASVGAGPSHDISTNLTFHATSHSSSTSSHRSHNAPHLQALASSTAELANEQATATSAIADDLTSQENISDTSTIAHGENATTASGNNNNNNNVDTAFSNLFPSFNFINFPTSNQKQKQSKNISNSLANDNGYDDGGGGDYYGYDDYGYDDDDYDNNNNDNDDNDDDGGNGNGNGNSNGNGSDYNNGQDGVSVGSSSLDSSLVNRMADDLFDGDYNVRQSLINVSNNRNFYSNYYDMLVKRQKQSKTKAAGAGSAGKTTALDLEAAAGISSDDNAAAQQQEQEQGESDFQKYITEFNKEFKIESKLKKVLEQKKIANDNLRRKNVINVISDENYLAENFYVPDDDEEEMDISDMNSPTHNNNNNNHAEPQMLSSSGEKASLRMNFLSKKSFASFNSIKNNKNNSSPKQTDFKISSPLASSSVSRKKLKHKDSAGFLKNLLGKDTQPQQGTNNPEKSGKAMNQINPFKFKIYASSSSLINTVSMDNSGSSSLNMNMNINKSRIPVPVPTPAIDDDLTSIASSTRTQNIDGTDNRFGRNHGHGQKFATNRKKLGRAFGIKQRNSRCQPTAAENYTTMRRHGHSHGHGHGHSRGAAAPVRMIELDDYGSYNDGDVFDGSELNSTSSSAEIRSPHMGMGTDASCCSHGGTSTLISNCKHRVGNIRYGRPTAIGCGPSRANDDDDGDDDDDEAIHPNVNERKNGSLQKKLTQRHLQMIALSGTFGVGLYLSASKNFSISGPFGALLGFVISGSIVLSTMLSLCEMVTFIPLVGGVSGIGSRFVDDAFGFAVGFIYWINYTISLPSEITAGTIMLSYYDNIQLPGKSVAGWITFFLAWTLLVNLLDVRVYGELEFFFSLIKLVVCFLSILLNIVINTGGMPPQHTYYGFRFWDSGQSEPSKGLTYGLFRPTFDLTDTGTGSLDGIGGNTGRFLSLLISICISMYAYVGTEIVVIVAGEAKHPRRALPSATNRIFWRILVFYILAIFCVGLNFYSGDPRLLRYRTVSKPTAKNTTAIETSIIKLFGGQACSKLTRNQDRLSQFKGLYNGNQSPWIIALQNARQCSLSAVFNGLFVVFALSAGSSQLYASSRTLYQMSVEGKAPSVFAKCSKQGVPYVAVLFSGMFGALAYLCINNDSNYVFQRLMTICSTSGEIVWACMCLAFIRYYYGLKQRTDLISRSSPAFPYKAPLQPYLAYFGLIGGIVVVLSTGITVFFNDYWSAEFFVTSYGALILFICSYFIYKFVKGTKILKVDQIQLDVGRKENDKIIWEETKAYSSNLKEKFMKTLEVLFG